jgi:hypothetical protein
MITSPKTRQAVVLDDAPAPTVMAAGIANVRHNGAYRVETVAGSTAASEKPPYRVPLMAELGEIEPNGYTVVSTFSGCVGSCLGFRLAGYRVLWASEFIDAAAETYAANHPTTPLDRRDIRRVTGAEILAAVGRERGDVDVLEGSPPCASFSTAGKRSAGWGSVKPYSDTSQRVDDLFFEYARLVDEIRPRAFVAENVSGLVKGVAKGYFLEILRALRAPGYVVAARLLDAQWLGVGRPSLARPAVSDGPVARTSAYDVRADARGLAEDRARRRRRRERRRVARRLRDRRRLGPPEARRDVRPLPEPLAAVA